MMNKSIKIILVVYTTNDKNGKFQIKKDGKFKVIIRIFYL